MASSTNTVSKTTLVGQPGELLSAELSFLSLKDLALAMRACKDIRAKAEEAFKLILRQTKTLDFMPDCRKFSAYTLHKVRSYREILDLAHSVTCFELRDIYDLDEVRPDQTRWERLGAILESPNARKLTRLYVSLPSSADYVSNTCVEPVARLCPNLTDLSIHWQHRVTDTGTAHLASLKKLTQVSFYCSQDVGDGTLDTLSKLPALTSVRLAGCERITAAGIRTLLQDAQKLQHLDVGNSAGGHFAFQEQARIAATIAEYGQNLRSLVCGMWYASADVCNIATRCQNLESIDLYGLSSETVPDEAQLAKDLAKANPNLKVMGLRPPQQKQGP